MSEIDLVKLRKRAESQKDLSWSERETYHHNVVIQLLDKIDELTNFNVTEVSKLSDIKSWLEEAAAVKNWDFPRVVQHATNLVLLERDKLLTDESVWIALRTYFPNAGDVVRALYFEDMKGALNAVINPGVKND